jgi:hypothetical protein
MTSRALREGLHQTLQFRKLIALFYVVNLLAAVVVVAPVVLLIAGSLGHSLESDRLLLNLDPSWIVETLYHFQFWPLNSTAVAFALVGLAFLLLNTFLAGGVLAVFHREQDALFSACARYFGRLLRLMLISLILYGLVAMLSNGAAKAIDHARESSMEAKPWIILGWIRLASATFLFGMVNMIFDYAKIILVVGERRSALRAALRAIGFVARHPLRTFAVYWVCAAAAFLLLLVYHGLTEALGQTSSITVVLVLVIRQCYTLARVWMRLWTWSSELHLYAFNSTIVAPVPPSLAVAE